MKGEIPVCKRCCFCLPLRYGLLVWGYIKMTADAIIITLMTFSMINTVMMIRVSRLDDDYRSRIVEDMILPVIADAVFIADFVATIVFIVGGHKKNVRLMRVFYFISIVMLIFTLLVTTSSIVLVIQNLLSHLYSWKRELTMFSFYFVVLAVQTYFLLLLRSEIIKLKNIGEFRFVNNAAEAECTMKCEEINVEEEIRPEGETDREVV